jgi:hypothetical protein
MNLLVIRKCTGIYALTLFMICRNNNDVRIWGSYDTKDFVVERRLGMIKLKNSYPYVFIMNVDLQLII